MSVVDIIVLSLIVTVFATFGIVVSGLTWYCSDKRNPTHRSTGHHKHSGNLGLAIDD